MKNIKLADKDSYVTVQKDGETFLLTVEELISFFENSKKEECSVQEKEPIKFDSMKDIPENFTGACKIFNEICNGYDYYVFKDGMIHNETGPAAMYPDGQEGWFYKDEYYGSGDDYNNVTWGVKVSELRTTSG